MLDEKDFINEIWNKYDKYQYKRNSKNDFFKKHYYKNNEYILAIKSFITFIISILTTTGIVYAGITTYKFIQNSTSTDFKKNQGYDYNQDMICNNGIYYKKIYTYEEYENAKKIWDNLVEIEKEEFKDYFIIILAGENYNTTGLYISDIYVKEPKLCIELRKKDVWSEDDTVISTKLSKELNREQIDIINLPNNVDTSNKYKNIDYITNDYTIEEAIKDNCFVINEKNQVVSNDKEMLNDFVDNVNNKIDDLIRICIYESNRIIICDIECLNNKINMVEKVIESNNINTKYYTGDGISYKKRPSLGGTGYSYDYFLNNENGKGTIICIIKY